MVQSTCCTTDFARIVKGIAMSFLKSVRSLKWHLQLSRPASRRARRFPIQATQYLESRRLLDGTLPGVLVDAVVQDGKLQVTLHESAETLSIRFQPGQLEFAREGMVTETCSLEGISEILITGTEGPDRLNVDFANDPEVDLATVLVVTGGGDDVVTITGMYPPLRRFTWFYTEDGRDLVDASNSIHGVQAFTGTGRDTVIGSKGDDRISSGGGNDLVFGRAGNDSIGGQGGADTLIGGRGNDAIYGSGGNDLIFGNRGNDALEGEEGNDTIFGGADGDWVYGGTGHDRLMGQSGGDWVQGGDGADRVYGGTGNDLLQGGSGRDRLCGRAGDDTLEGGGGYDILFGGPGRDSLAGGYRSDVFAGGPGVDVIADLRPDDILRDDDAVGPLGEPLF